MDTLQNKIDFINALNLDERINHWQDLILLSNKYLNSENINDSLSLKIINCFNGIRISRFIDSDIDIKLLDISLLVARKLENQNIILKGILNDILYYSNYYPEKYNKLGLEKEIKKLNETI